MPQDMAFVIPFQAPISPYLEHARASHLRWVCERSLVRSEAALREYESWDLPLAAARTYPYASPEDMTMIMNFMAVEFLLDGDGA